jgi:hypothetical protein
MLRVFLLLLSFFTDYEAVAGVAHRILTAGLVNVSILWCVGVSLIARQRLVNRRQTVLPAGR